MARRKNTKVGDIIAIPVDPGVCAYAQVLVKHHILYVVVFEQMRRCDFSDVTAIVGDGPALAGWTLDSKIFHGQWSVIANVPVINWEGFKTPYKVGYLGEMWVESFDGRRSHIASREERESLHYRTTFSPVSLENAIRAYHKLEPWISDFDPLLVK